MEKILVFEANSVAGCNYKTNVGRTCVVLSKVNAIRKASEDSVIFFMDGGHTLELKIPYEKVLGIVKAVDVIN